MAWKAHSEAWQSTKLAAALYDVAAPRYPTLPVAELQRHQAPVNALAWAPHSSCHICSAGDDAQALIWDLSTMSHPMDHGLGAASPVASPENPPI